MGRRKKAAKKVAKKKKPTVARTFKCLFCNHQDVVSCRLDMKSMTGEFTRMYLFQAHVTGSSSGIGAE